MELRIYDCESYYEEHNLDIIKIKEDIGESWSIQRGYEAVLSVIGSGYIYAHRQEFYVVNAIIQVKNDNVTVISYSITTTKSINNEKPHNS